MKSNLMYTDTLINYRISELNTSNIPEIKRVLIGLIGES